MPCFHPLTAFVGKDFTANGKRPLVFNRSQSLTGIPQKLPCGQCMGCRLEKSAQWAGRIINEAQMHIDNMMATFTYRPECLPERGAIQYSDMQKFYKRLRRAGFKIRHFTGSEYGAESGRPHYHGIIFGYWPEDAKLWRQSGDKNYYIAESLTAIWGLGHVEFTDVNFSSAQYVAQYCISKITGSLAADHYERMDPETGEIYWLPAECGRMSLRPAIGATWLEKYFSDVYPSDDYAPRPGRSQKTPKHYDTLLERSNPELYAEIKERRRNDALLRASDNTPQRLLDREKCAIASINLKKGRGL